MQIFARRLFLRMIVLKNVPEAEDAFGEDR